MRKWLLVIVRLDYSIHCVSSIWLFSSQGIPTSSYFVPTVFPLIFGDAALKVFGALIDAKSLRYPEKFTRRPFLLRLARQTEKRGSWAA